MLLASGELLLCTSPSHGFFLTNPHCDYCLNASEFTVTAAYLLEMTAETKKYEQQMNNLSFRTAKCDFLFLRIHITLSNVAGLCMCIGSEVKNKKPSVLLTSSNHPLCCVFSFRVFLLLLNAAAD